MDVMEIEIYQIKDAEKKRLVAKALSDRPGFTAPEPVDPSMYHRVFMGDVECKSPYELVFLFNTVGHRLFRGEKLGLSDVIRIKSLSEDVCFLYDRIGVSLIEFDTEKVLQEENLIRVLVVEPHRIPFESEIENTLEGEQKAVEGLLQYLYNGDGTITVINDESKLNGMEGNRRIKGDVLVGPFFIAGDNGETLCSLTNEQMSYYAERFAEPEEISREEIEEHCKIMFFSW